MAYTTIDNPELYFQVKTYTGTGSSNAITLDGSENMQPDLVWNKIRSTTGIHRMTDAVRGVTKELYPDIVDAEDTQAQGVTAFGSNGFTVGTNAGYNTSSATYVAWCWKEQSGIFDIVGYTGNDTARTISHSLSAVPHMMIIKKRSQTGNWAVYHHKNTSAPQTDVLYLDTDGATQDDTWFNDTVPTSSVFSVDGSGAVNNNGQTIIAYLFSEKQGYSKFGSFKGTENADGATIWCGFRPAFVMFKNSGMSSTSWVIVDNKRQSYNGNNNSYLYADTNSAEQTGVNVDLLSNGFKTRHNLSWINEETITYMAFAEAPFVNSKGVPCNAR